MISKNGPALTVQLAFGLPPRRNHLLHWGHALREPLGDHAPALDGVLPARRHVLCDHPKFRVHSLSVKGMDYFEWEVYLLNNPDLAGYSETDARNHYVRYGKAEGRTSAMIDNFSWLDYVITYPDLRHMTRMEAYRHYIEYGKREGRVSRR